MKQINAIYLLSTLAVLLLFSEMNVNAQVTVVLQQPPPFQFKIENMWKVTLINPTQTTYTVYLQGTATESTKGQIVSATTAVFSLAPGVKIVNTQDLTPMHIDATNENYSNVVKNIGVVPTGDYEICVTVINAKTGMQLGEQCMESQVQNLSQVELLRPENNTKFLSGAANENNSDDIGESQIISGSFITFTWLPPSPLPPGVKATYSIRISEIYGNQSPYDAVLSNRAFFIDQNIYSNVFLYPVEGRSFENNRRYAWKVSAYLNNTLVSESETWEFTYKDNSEPNPVDGKKNVLFGDVKSPDSFNEQELLVASTDYAQLLDIINSEESKSPAPPFLFSGNAKFSLDAGYKELPFSELSNSLITSEFNPSVTIYGLPFTANILLSVPQASDRQSTNSAALNFDINSYKEQLKLRLGTKIKELEKLNGELDASTIDSLINHEGLNENVDSLKSIPGWKDDLIKKYKKEQLEALNNPQKLTDNLDQLGLISGWEKFFMSIDAFGIGTNYPSYSDYTLKGVPVTGINVEVNPGIFYAAFAASNNQRSIENIAYQRSIYAGRLGIGKKDETHFFFTGLYAKDNENSTTVAPDNLTLTPEANYVLGAETKLALFDDHILIEGEGNAAALTRDTRDAVLEIDAIPGFIRGMISPKISTSFDYSYAGKMSYNNTGSATRISIDMKMVGPGYSSLGAPNLRTDQLAYEAKVEQAFFGRKISISTFFNTSHDNLIDWKSSTTTTSAFGINFGMNFPKIPFLQFSYSPYLQKNDNPVPAQQIENRTTMISAVTGYALLIQEFILSTNLAFSNNKATTLNGLSDFSTNSISVTEAVSFNSPISFAGTWGLITSSSPVLYSHLNNFDFSVNAAITESISNTLGINIANDRSVDTKTNIYYNLIYSPTKNINLNARIGGADYENLVDGSLTYTEVLFNIMFSISW